MIGFIDAFFYNLSYSQSITTARNKWLPKTRSILTGIHLSSFLVFSLMCLCSELLYEWLSSSFSFLLRLPRFRVRLGDTLRLAVHRQSVHFGDKPLETHDQQLFFNGILTYITSSLTRGWVCRLQLLLVFASAVILRSESRGTHDHILLSQIWDSPQPGGPGPRIYIPQEQGVPIIAAGAGFPYRRQLPLAGLRWRYLTSPPHGSASFLIWTAAYIALRYPRRCLLLARIHGHACWFYSNELVCVQESYLRWNVFANSFPRNGLHVTMYQSIELLTHVTATAGLVGLAGYNAVF
jgi:hypothetical protein